MLHVLTNFINLLYIMNIQAVLFDKTIYDTEMARKWLKHHKMYAIKKVHETANKLRYRIRQPDKKYRYITKTLDNGVEAVIIVNLKKT